MSRIEALALFQLVRVVQWIVSEHFIPEQVQNVRTILGAAPLVLGIEAKLIDLDGAECIKEADVELGEATTAGEGKGNLLQPALLGDDLQASHQVGVVDEASTLRQVRDVWSGGIFEHDVETAEKGSVVGTNHVEEMAHVHIAHLLALGGPERDTRDLGAAEGEPIFGVEDAAAFLVDETAGAQERRTAGGILGLGEVNWLLGHENLAIDVVSKL
jgi:hypothetical protein